jgi:hypothetical protein
MKTKDTLIRIFTGTEISVITLKGRLEEIGVSSIIRNEYQLGVDVGFVGGVKSAVDLYIHQSDFNKAEQVITEFSRKNKNQNEI